MSTSTPTSGGPLRSLQLIGASMTGAIVLVCVAMLAALPHEQAPPLIGVAILLVVAVAMFGLSRFLDGRVEPLEPRLNVDEAAAMARSRYTSAIVTRYALAETPAFVGIVLGFVLEPSTWFTVAVGLVVSAPLLLLAWPSTASIEAMQSRLESRGARTSLRARLTGDDLR